MLTAIEMRTLQEAQRLLRYASKQNDKPTLEVERVASWPDEVPLPDYQSHDNDGQVTYVKSVRVRAHAETAATNKWMSDRQWWIQVSFIMSDGDIHQAFRHRGKGDLSSGMNHMYLPMLDEISNLLARFVSEAIDEAKE